MIGDHKQLRPPVNCYALQRRLQFDVSLFERLINNGIPHGILGTQNRMRPEFVELLRPIYPDLRSNHARVDGHRAPSCVGKSMWWWTHSDPELPGRSFSNKGEAERVVSLALFFVQQGYLPSQVSILAAYQGQAQLLRDKVKGGLQTVFRDPKEAPGARVAQYDGTELKEAALVRMPPTDVQALMAKLKVPCSVKHPTKKDRPKMIDQLFAAAAAQNPKKEIAVHTIDQFQGDENDIVIVSLVRSNPSGDIGFLQTLNRYCVACSRARCGVYFVGNAVTLTKRPGPWLHMAEEMRRSACAGTGDALPLLCPRHPGSARQIRTGAEIDLQNGFCGHKCGHRMPCQIHCCPLPCHVHTAQHDQCTADVHFRHPQCGCPCVRPCHVPEEDVVCRAPCRRGLPCGHPCPDPCGEPCAESCQVCREVLEWPYGVGGGGYPPLDRPPPQGQSDQCVTAPNGALLDCLSHVCHGFAVFRHEVLLRMPGGFRRVTTIADLWPK